MLLLNHLLLSFFFFYYYFGVLTKFPIDVVAKSIVDTVINFSFIIGVSLSIVVGNCCFVNIVFVQFVVDVYYCYLYCFINTIIKIFIFNYWCYKYLNVLFQQQDCFVHQLFLEKVTSLRWTHYRIVWSCCWPFSQFILINFFKSCTIWYYFHLLFPIHLP